jgi:hypothetical protein
MSSQNRIGLILALVVLISAAAVLFSRATQASDVSSRVGDVSVSCGPAQRAVVQQLGAGTSPQIHVVCVEDVAAQPAVQVARPLQPVLPAGYAGMATAVPAVAYAPAPQTVQPVVVANAQPVSAPVRRASSSRPSTEKRLLVIGGTAGAGAGIGALVGGKKGALIGAAIGAGGATIVDQVKHR